MKLLFIGGRGNISAECAAWAFQNGHEVAVVSRGRSQVPKDYQVFQADRKSLAEMRQSLGNYQPDVVLNFLGYEIADLEIDYVLFKDKIRQYIFISSATVYAKPPPRLPIREDCPLANPWWAYAQKKIECELWLNEKFKTEAFPSTIVRPSHTYSKHWVPNPVSSSSYTFVARLESGKAVYVPDNGENPWTLTASSDFAVGLGGLIGQAQAIGEAFHVTSDEVLTWNSIVRQIADALAIESPEIVKVPTALICEVAPEMVGPLKGDKTHPGIFDNSKIKRFVPEFICRKPFAVGVRESIAWLRAHPEEKNLRTDLDRLIDDVITAFRKSIGAKHQ